ncbi:hypothetical protein [Streptomyces sp. NPDC090022]|uniref:hypothetical protein n=1 Tax=Streptomyces sp. NPDC090022 TaxID=3365920 RepID=UPI00380E036F
MFIRPVGAVVQPARRPAGRPLLRGLLARGAYVWDAAQVAEPEPEPPEGPGGSPPPWEPAEPEAPYEEVWSAGPWASAGRAGPREAPEPAPPAGTGTGTEAGDDFTSRLLRLAALAREGLLTPEEFAAAKTRLLRG